ncbi:unnamed protein product [Xylocopa violacea]|uniref:Uncharacterized protein n=1 Tax=Xylocopa violacea TaxID=135666 RepID=A0ABP1NIA6_XYLVO
MFWCAPRKVKSMTIEENEEANVAVEGRKSKKRHRKKRQRNVTNSRRIDILAQPKSMKHKQEQKNRSSNVTESTRIHKIPRSSQNLKNQTSLKEVRPPKSSKMKNIKASREFLDNFRKIPTSKDSSSIVLPKKIGIRLFSLGQAIQIYSLLYMYICYFL